MTAAIYNDAGVITVVCNYYTIAHKIWSKPMTIMMIIYNQYLKSSVNKI